MLIHYAIQKVLDHRISCGVNTSSSIQICLLSGLYVSPVDGVYVYVSWSFDGLVSHPFPIKLFPNFNLQYLLNRNSFFSF